MFILLQRYECKILGYIDARWYTVAGGLLKVCKSSYLARRFTFGLNCLTRFWQVARGLQEHLPRKWLAMKENCSLKIKYVGSLMTNLFMWNSNATRSSSVRKEWKDHWTNELQTTIVGTCLIFRWFPSRSSILPFTIEERLKYVTICEMMSKFCLFCNPRKINRFTLFNWHQII